MSDIPIVCIPSALTAEERARSLDLRERLAAAIARVREEADGYAFEYRDEPEIFRVAGEWIGLERRCCPFMSFELRAPRDGAPTLRLSGPEGTKAFLGATLPELPHQAPRSACGCSGS